MKQVTILIILTAMISACNKYPEGNDLSLKKTEKRMMYKWEVVHCYINSIDSTEVFHNNHGCYIDMSEYFTDRVKASGYFYQIKRCVSDSVYSYGYWQLEEKKRILVISKEYLSKGIFDFIYDTKWDIKKIEDNELIIETSENGKEYRLEMIKNE